MYLYIKSIGDPLKCGGIVADIVQFRDFGCGVAEQVGNLLRRQSQDGAIGLFHTVAEACGIRVSEGVQTEVFR